MGTSYTLGSIVNSVIKDYDLKLFQEAGILCQNKWYKIENRNNYELKYK